MFKKFLCVTFIIIIFFNYFNTFVYAETDIYRFWNNLPSNNYYNGSVVDYGTLPTQLSENDKYLFYYYHNWAGGHVDFHFGFAVFRNATTNFNAIYSPQFSTGDGVVDFSNFVGCTIYSYNPSNYGYSVIYNDSNATTYQLSHIALIGYNAEQVYRATIPSIFYSNFDILNAYDTTNIVYYGGIYNSSLVFEDASVLKLGGNSNNNFVLTNYFGNYNPTYEPVLYVYVGNSVIAETLVNTVYLNSFRLNSGDYNIPYNRIYPETYSPNTKIWFLLKTTDNNNNFVYSLTNFTTTGTITIDDFEPTEPGQNPIPTPTPGGNDYTEIINSQQQTTNAIQDQTEVIQTQTNAIQEQTQAQEEFNNNFYNDEPDIPSNIDIQDNTINNTADLTQLFNNIRNSFNSRDGNDKEFVFTLPNGDNFTISLPVGFIRRILSSNNALLTFLSAFWYVVFGGYVVFDLKKIYNKFKNGDFESAMNSSSTDNVVKEALR